MSPNLLAPLVRKLESRVTLYDEDRAAILALPFRLQTTERETYLVREGEQPERACMLLSGFAFRQKVTSQGMRQIISLHIPGDFVDLQGVLLNLADHNVQALTRCEFAIVARNDIRALACTRPMVGLAMWTDTLIDASIFREWVVNVGRRDAMTRIAHLLCELARRMEAAGLADRLRYEMPMSQEQLADATGLTPVHVNRMLRDLDRSGLIVRNHRTIVIRDWEGLSELADFNENYLHLDQLITEAARIRTGTVPAARMTS
ncbi:Crp/Fnr family transcriptional regulator [Sphingomonas sp. MS122]|uniref:Crp/Fnr family transcriptional regulator n=1 Tax=Sphingomonas sp. MS122 TaxID=3412683 RepID=UPI003C2D21D5